MDLPLMIAKWVAPSRVIVLTTNAPGGTSPWSVPPDATFPVGFQLIGQNGLRVPASMVKLDLFLSAITGSSAFFGAAGAGAASWAGFVFVVAGAAGAGAGAAPSASNNAGAAKIDINNRDKNLFIAFQLRWSRRSRLVGTAAVRAARECSIS